ncbi:MAG TPA: hypothetical protein VNY36_02870, partial [Bacteroidia bacterium]|nr:hypothetical protein [Bacteroidia bacterium]
MKRFSLAVIFIIILIGFGYTAKNRWKGEDGYYWQGTINSDGLGYYAYLPCIFIYHSLDYRISIKEAQKIHAGTWGPFIYFQNKLINKCFPGVALLLAPFFLIAYWLSHIMGYNTGGYEFPFQASVSIAALFYLAVGLIFIRKLLKEFQVSEFVISLTLILLVLGT